jgi:hypothetical protein
MEKCRWALGGVLAFALLCSATSSRAAEDKAPPEDKAVADSKAGEVVFEMKEVSLFDQKDGAANSQYPMSGGQSASLSTQPAKEVKAYPKLKSKQPLYGSIVLNRNAQKPGRATKFYFVVDESNPAEEPADGKAAESPADKPAAKKAAQKRYDVLYFDFDHDLDLSNDAAVSPMKDPPKSVGRYMYGPRNTVVFDTISVPLGEDAKANGQTVRVLPLVFSNGTAGQIMFMTASARKGDIRLGKRAYSAMLFSRSGPMGRLDDANTQLILTPVDGPKSTGYSYLNMLGTIREADGEFYRITATPSGDKLTVRVCDGDRGAFELSAGTKEVKPLGMVGILRLKDSMMPIGDLNPVASSERSKTAKYNLPVGDYQPLMLKVDYGDLQVSLRADYTRTAGGASKPVGSIEIRKDKPYVLDFATKPEVNFQAPPKEKTFKPGEVIRLAAVLRIPDKGLLIGGLDDMTKKTGEMRYMGEDGKPVTVPRYASLEPKVVITDSAGKKVAEGTMPFG